MPTQPSDVVNILLVDDRPENLLALAALLEQPGLRIVTAASGNDALEQLLDEDFALVLLDVKMPGMDGFEVAELMRGNTRTREIPIIFVTAMNKEPQHIVKGYDAGAVDYLFKPINPHVLLSKVNVFAELYRQRQMLNRANQELAQTVVSLTAANQRLLEQQKSVIEEERLTQMLQLAGAGTSEMNQPLMSLLGNIELLRLIREQPDRLEQQLQRIEAEARRLADIVQRVQMVQQQNTCIFTAGRVLMNTDQILRILVVDTSDEDTRRLAALLGEYTHIECFSVITLASALQETARNVYDIILLDYTLPDGTGMDLIHHLATQDSAPPVVMITGEGDAILASRAIQAGAYDYLPKEMLTSQSLLRAIGNALEKARLKQESRAVIQKMSEMTIKDELTDLYNRRYIFEALESEMANALRHGTAMNLAMIDLDDLASVNDRRGHPAGDAVLKEFSRLLREILRRADVRCRYGGDEFAVIFSGISLENALHACERLRNAVANHVFMYAGIPLRITLSIGVAAFIPKTHRDPRLLVENACQALAEAKTEGRNRVVGYSARD